MGDDPARYLERESPLGGLPTAAGRPAPRLSQLELSSMPGGGAALSPGRRERPWRPGVLRGEGRAEAGRLCLGSAPGCRSLPSPLGGIGWWWLGVKGEAGVVCGVAGQRGKRGGHGGEGGGRNGRGATRGSLAKSSHCSPFLSPGHSPSASGHQSHS